MTNKDRIIDYCIESKAMSDYLKTQELDDYDLTQIITGSTLNLEQKLELYKLLDGEHSKILSIETQKAIDSLEALPGEFFCLSECWYDDEILDKKVYFSEPFTTFEAALDYVREMIEDEEWDDETEAWTYIEKWVPDENGKMKCPYAYYLIKDQVVYFDVDDYPSHHQYQGYVSSMSLNLPIPFKVGDIVTLNSIPFAPPKQAILLEVENVDCCGVQMLYRLENGLWETGALKHGHGWKHGYPMLSTLYRLSKFTGELKEEEKLMSEVRVFVKKDEKHGRILWNAIFEDEIPEKKRGGVTEESIREFINNKSKDE